jgi:hypothetical protein
MDAPTNETAPSPKTEGRNVIRFPIPSRASVTERDDTRQVYSAQDARCIVARLQTTARDRFVVDAGCASGPIVTRSRYCCAAVGLEVLAARAGDGDPRCPCARAAGWHRELVGVTS